MSMNILLVGKTGHGKSATGNTLLDMGSFDCEPSPTSTTHLTQVSFANYNGIQLRVIDTPGIFETRKNETHNNKEDIEFQCEVMNNLVKSFKSSGVNAFFFMYNIMSKYTKEEEVAINSLITIFGERAISTFGVLVFTHGDQFNGKPFKEWMSEQTGKLGDLIRMFNGKVLLISNNSDYQDLISNSRKEMITLVMKIQNQSKICYTLKDYDEQENNRKLMILNENILTIKEKYMKKSDSLEYIINKRSVLTEDEIDYYTKKIDNLINKIRQISLGTEKLDVELQQLDKLKKTVRIEKNIVNIKDKYKAKIESLKYIINQRSVLTEKEIDYYTKKIDKLINKIRQISLGTKTLDVELEQLDQLKTTVRKKNRPPMRCTLQ